MVVHIFVLGELPVDTRKALRICRAQMTVQVEEGVKGSVRIELGVVWVVLVTQRPELQRVTFPEVREDDRQRRVVEAPESTGGDEGRREGGGISVPEFEELPL